MNTLELEHRFEEIYGKRAEHTYFAPGRVNLIGEHTDYNGGLVFPCALSFGTYLLIAKREDRQNRFSSVNMDRSYTANANAFEDKPTAWIKYPIGVMKEFAERGSDVWGYDLLYYGNIPNGAGLSSSASIEVVTAVMLNDVTKVHLDMTELVKISQKAENDYVGVNCGIMDQFTVAVGKKDNAIFLDTNTLQYEYAPILLEDSKIIITNSKVKHSLVTSEYNVRRQECADALSDLQKELSISSLGELTPEEFEEAKHLIRDEVRVKRAKHAVYENQRTIAAVKALKEGDITKFGELMNQSHVSLRDDYEVSCKEIDLLVDLSWNTPGVIGSRITGGGFGGCTVSIVKNEAVDNFIKNVGEAYKEKFGYEAEFYVVDIGVGASRLDV